MTVAFEPDQAVSTVAFEPDSTVAFEPDEENVAAPVRPAFDEDTQRQKMAAQSNRIADSKLANQGSLIANYSVRIPKTGQVSMPDSFKEGDVFMTSPEGSVDMAGAEFFTRTKDGATPIKKEEFNARIGQNSLYKQRHPEMRDISKGATVHSDVDAREGKSIGQSAVDVIKGVVSGPETLAQLVYKETQDKESEVGSSFNALRQSSMTILGDALSGAGTLDQLIYKDMGRGDLAESGKVKQEMGETFTNAAKKVYATNPLYKGTALETMASAAGSALPFVATGGIGGFLGPASSSLLGALSSVEQEYKQAVQNGADPAQAKRAALSGLLIGASEGVLGIGRGGASSLGKLVTRGVEEGLQEGLQGWSSKLNQALNSDKKMPGYQERMQEIADTMEQMAAGVILGSGMAVPAALANSLARKQKPEPVTVEDRVKDSLEGPPALPGIESAEVIPAGEPGSAMPKMEGTQGAIEATNAIQSERARVEELLNATSDAGLKGVLGRRLKAIDEEIAQGAETPTGEPPPTEPPPTEPAAAPPETSGDGQPIGVKHEITDRLLAEIGLPERESPVTKEFATEWEKAKAKAADAPGAGSALVENFLAEPRPAKPEETALLTHETIVRKKEFDNARKAVREATTEEEIAEAGERFEKASGRMEEQLDVNRFTGSELGQGLAFRKLMAKEDFSHATMHVRAKKAKGEPLSEPEAARVEAQAEALRKNKEAQEANAQKEADAETSKAFERMINEGRKEAKGAAKKGKTVREFLQEQANQASARIRKRRGEVQAIGIIPDLYDRVVIGASWVANGLHDFGAWSKEAIKHWGASIEPHLPEIFKRSQEYHGASEKAFTPKGPKTREQLIEKAKTNAEAGKELSQKTVFDLVRTHWNEGKLTVEENMKAVHADLAPHIEGLTEQQVRDAFTREGKAPTRAEDVKAVQKMQRELKALNKPQVSPDAKKLASDKKAIRARIDKIKERIRAKNYEPPAKKDPVTDKEKRDLQYEEVKLKEQFANDLFEHNLAKRTKGQIALDVLKEISDTAQTLQVSFDESGFLRQGGALVAAHPLRSRKAFKDMMKSTFSERDAHDAYRRIMERPNAPDDRISGLRFDDPFNINSNSPEGFRGRWARKLFGVEQSARGFAAVANKLRADSYDAAKAFLEWNGTPLTVAEKKFIANYINVASGRGSKAAQTNLSGWAARFMYAPRWVFSRFQYVLGQPLWTGALSKDATLRTRAFVALEYSATIASMGVLYSLASLFRDEKDKEEPRFDPRYPSAYKIKVRGKRGKPDAYYDPTFGLGTTVRFLAQMVTGEKLDKRGKVIPLRQAGRPLNYFRKRPLTDKPDYGKDSAIRTIGRFAWSKAGPLPDVAVSTAAGEDYMGNKATLLPDDWTSLEGLSQSKLLMLPVPLFSRDIFKAEKQLGLGHGTVHAIVTGLGVGGQVYEPKKEKALR